MYAHANELLPPYTIFAVLLLILKP